MALTLDARLADKLVVDAEVADAVRAEMRDILTGFVAAEKEAEVNVIRRREETNATHSLLNTARVMVENPVMIRSKSWMRWKPLPAVLSV